MISESTKLDTNLDCRVTGLGGLEIGADDITINLNGYTIFGDYSAPSGISGLGHSGVTIRNGAISGFMSVILLSDSSHITVEHLTIAHQAIKSVFVGHSSHVRIENIQISLDYDPFGYETIGVLLFEVQMRHWRTLLPKAVSTVCNL